MKKLMRIFVILICSLSLALVNATAQEPQGTKEKKKAAPTGHAQPGKPTGKPGQVSRPAGPPGKPAEYGKPKGSAYPSQVNKPAEYGKRKGQGQVVNANKPPEYKAKGKGQVANPNKPAEYGKAKGQKQPYAAVAGKPGKAGGNRIPLLCYFLRRQLNSQGRHGFRLILHFDFHESSRYRRQ